VATRQIEAIQTLGVFQAETLALLCPSRIRFCQVLPVLYDESYGCKSVCTCWQCYAAPMELIAICFA
jgi:hypothetical protein